MHGLRDDLSPLPGKVPGKVWCVMTKARNGRNAAKKKIKKVGN